MREATLQDSCVKEIMKPFWDEEFPEKCRKYVEGLSVLLPTDRWKYHDMG